MDVELMEVRDFLAAHPPFDELPAAALDRLPRALSVRYLRRGRPFPPDDAVAELVIVRQGALELRNDRDELVAKYGEGDVYDALCPGGADVRGLAGFAVEDTLLYLLPCEAFAELRASHPAFDQYFARSVRDKLRRAVDALRAAPALGGGLMTIDVGALAQRSPVHVAPETPIADAARLMTRERVSSVLVMRAGRLEGIVTDRDLRQRCLAAGVPGDAPVERIMTAGVHAVARDAPAFEALLAMTRLGVPHLPVLDGDRVAGMVTTTDLVRHQSAQAVYLAEGVRGSASVRELAEVSARIPELQIQMVAAGATPRHLGLAVGAVVDALTRRLLELAEADLGPPPVARAWLACGSQARHEQTALSDQDNALLLSDELRPEEHAAYFAALARFVNDGLAACGFPLCPGKVMASHDPWRQPLAGWRRHFDGWIERPEPKALMHATIFFDMRAVGGGEELAARLRDHVFEKLRGNEVFIAHLVANALLHPPPLGFFRSFVLVHGGEHADTLNLKRGGMMPIVDLARIYALVAGSRALGTVERLRDAAAGGAVTRAGAEDLEHALAFVGTLRARLQAEQMKRGLPPQNHFRPDALSLLERSQLKDAFAVVREHQGALAQIYRARWIV